MDIIRLEDVIRQYVHIPNHANTSGWHSVLCKVCNDKGHKGPRAAFKFDGETVGYNCFNCDAATVYDPSKHTTIPDKMITVLNEFGVPEDVWRQVLFSALTLENSPDQAKSINTNIEPQELELPKHFYPLDTKDNDNKWAVIAADYLACRKVDVSKHNLYLSTGEGSPDAKRWKGRLILPVYKDNKLIFWQGRALVKMKRKYLSPDYPKDKVLYGFDKLFEHTDLPLYIVEGWFDAECINGVAVFGNTFSEAQVAWLTRSNRRKVVIPDRTGDGHLLAEQALELGWEVSFPEIGQCKDVSEAVEKYGKLYVTKSIIDKTMTGFEGLNAVGVFCKRGQDSNKKKSQKTSSKKGRGK